MAKSTSSVVDFRAKTSRSRASERDSGVSARACSTKPCDSSEECAPPSCFSRMSLDCSQAIKDTTSQQSSVKWGKGGVVRRSRGEYWTVSTSECPSAAAASSLQELLDEDTPLAFLLSRRAAQGILDRAKRRSRVLPALFEASLRANLRITARE